MSELIVIGYDTESKAETVRSTLAKLQVEHLIELEDAAVVVKDVEGKISLKQAVNLTAAGALSGGFWGLLIGSIFLNPILGAVVGSASGALSGSLSDIGVSDDFMRSLGQTLKPGSSALFVLIRKVTPDKVLVEIQPYGGTVLRTSLTKDKEADLQLALSGSSKAAALT